MTTYRIHYMKPDYFTRFIFGSLKPILEDLNQTHTYLRDVEIDGEVDRDEEEYLERIFAYMQGEVWSPNGEARNLILSKGLKHTSMSVGDVIQTPNGNYWVVANFGFQRLK